MFPERKKVVVSRLPTQAKDGLQGAPEIEWGAGNFVNTGHEYALAGEATLRFDRGRFSQPIATAAW